MFYNSSGSLSWKGLGFRVGFQAFQTLNPQGRGSCDKSCLGFTGWLFRKLIQVTILEPNYLLSVPLTVT